MSIINAVFSREILDSRGNPTVEVDVLLDNGVMGRAAVPSGASTGAHEAVELRDGDKKRYLGKGVQKAVQAVNTKIAEEIVGLEAFDQEGLDKKLREIDGTENKANLGANALLGVSLATAKAAAQASGLPLYRYVGGVSARKLPVPLMNILNGGAHADNGLDVQEFMIAPVVGGSFRESLRAGAEIFHTLKKILTTKGLSTGVGDEGGFAPKLKSNRQAMELVSEAISAAGYTVGKDVFLALDVAATELFEGGKYRWEGGQLTGEQLGGVYREWAKDFSLVSIEDGFSEDDWASWIAFNKTDGGVNGAKLQIVGDDLFVTNAKRVARGIKENAANALLVKVNQIGTLSETCEAVSLAQTNKMHTIMSHRSGETEDAMIADLAVALSCQQIKTGSLCRGERTAKYNQLLRIEEDLGATAQFWGRGAFFD